MSRSYHSWRDPTTRSRPSRPLPDDPVLPSPDEPWCVEPARSSPDGPDRSSTDEMGCGPPDRSGALLEEPSSVERPCPLDGVEGPLGRGRSPSPAPYTVSYRRARSARLRRRCKLVGHHSVHNARAGRRISSVRPGPDRCQASAPVGRTSAASITQETEPTVSRLVGQRGDPGPRGADSLVASPAKTRPRHLCPSRRSWRWAAAPAPEGGAGSQADVFGRPVHLTAATEGRSVWSSAPRRRGVRELRRRALGHEGRPSVRGARTARSERDRALRAAVRALPPAVSGPASHDARPG